MSDGDAPTCFANGIVAIVVVGVGHEHVPLAIDHVRVEVVWASGVIDVVPRINPGRIGFVRDIDERDRDLSGVAPLANVRVRIAWVNELVLLNDVFTAIVFEVLDIKHLRVRVVVHAHHRGVVWVGHVDNMHVVPPSKIGIGFTVGCGCHLDLGVPWCGQGIEIKQFHVVTAKGVLAGVLVIVTLTLNQWIVVSKYRIFNDIGLDIVSENQQGCRS